MQNRAVLRKERLRSGSPAISSWFPKRVWLTNTANSRVFNMHHDIGALGHLDCGADYVTPPLARWVVRVAILCLLFNLNFTLVAYWNQFVQTWGTESYIGALAGPVIGLGCGYLLVTSLRVKDVGIRHATEVTTAIRNIAPMLLMMIFPLQPTRWSRCRSRSSTPSAS